MLIFGGWSGFEAWSDVWALPLSGEPTWTEIEAPGGPAFVGHSAVYDPVRDRMVVYAGFEVWALSLTGRPTWSLLRPAGVRPPARGDHSAIYDPVRDRMIVFGGIGEDGVRRADVWALSLSEQSAWTEIVPVGESIRGRNRHSAVYDPVRDRMLVFGGTRFPAVSLNETWALSLAGTPTWTQLAPAGTTPPPRNAHGAVYDTMNDRMIVFGGGERPYGNDVWALSLAGESTWSPLIPPHPRPARRRHFATAHDPVRHRLVIFGGYEYDRFHNDTWALALTGPPHWKQLPPTPSPRQRHAAVHDPNRDRMLVFGGFDGIAARRDVWELPLRGGAIWSEIVPTNVGPAPRLGHAQVFDSMRDRLLVLGGSDNRLLHNDVWALSSGTGSTWDELVPSGIPPPPRMGHSAVYDAVRDRVVVFGGSDLTGATHYNDIWELALAGTPAWRRLEPTGSPPCPRNDHSAVYDASGDRLIVFGGHDGSGFRNDTWALSLGGAPAWTRVDPIGPAPPRSGHTAVLDASNARMLVFGGLDGSLHNDVWSMSLEGPPRWTSIGSLGLPPSGRQWHSAVFQPVRQRMVVFGGYFGSTSGDTWHLQLVRRVRIDVRPGNEDNVIHPGSAGLLPVAVAGELAFDVRSVDATTATFAGAPVARRPNGSSMASVKDLNGDGFPDLLMQFLGARLVIPDGLTEGQFLGRTLDELPLAGTDLIRVVPAPGRAEVTLEQSGGCRGPSTSGLAFRAVSPNPASRECTVSFALAGPGTVTLGLFDVVGRRVSVEQLGPLGPGEHHARLQTTSLPAGIYWLRLMGAGGEEPVSVRLVVLR
ncbi:MAG: Kelch repeat-containing protein [Candidatus Polarisedimenticolia bacterium]